jgi:hypothetical protein
VSISPLLLKANFVDPAHWEWHLTDANGAFLDYHQVVLDQADWRYEALHDLSGYLQRHAAPDRRREDETRLLAELGAWIGEKVLGPIAPALVSQAPVTVRVQIPADQPAAAGLAYLPLELAHVHKKPLALQQVSLVFEVGRAAPVALRQVGERLRMLAVFSLPSGEMPLNLRQERYRLKDLIRRLAAMHGWAIDLRVLQYGVTREALRNLLKDGEGWDLVHFSGHGLAAKLVLEYPDGSPDVVSSEKFVELLRLARGRLKWVTLSTCLSASGTVVETYRLLGLDPPRRFGAPAADEAARTAEPLPALAQTLVEELGCAVLAMRYPVGDAFAIELCNAIYRSVLENHNSLSQALQLALPETLSNDDCSPLAVATPALFGAAADLTFPIPRTEPDFETPTTGLALFPREPLLFVGRVDELAKASRALAPESRVAGVLFHGMAGAGKTSCALELVYHYEDLQRFQGYVWYRAPEQDKDIRGALNDFATAMENQLPKFKMRQAPGLEAFFPWLTQQLERQSILLVLDNLESLLSPEGRWKDERWGKLVAALLGHRGYSRVILTSRICPVVTGITRDALLVLPIHALSLDESALQARQSEHLGRLLRGDGATDSRQREQQRQAVVETLRLVQGHSMLLDLADRQAVDLETLKRHLAQAGQASTQGRGRLNAFFLDGESTLTDDDFLRILDDWTNMIAATLSVRAQDLFHFLCCLEEGDRQGDIVAANWADLWARLGRAGDPPALAASLAALIDVGLVDLDSRATDDPTASTQCYRLHPVVAQAGRRRAEKSLETFQEAVDTELIAYWQTVYHQAVQREMQGAGGRLIRAARAAVPYLLRQGHAGAAAKLLEQVLARDHSPSTVAALLPLVELTAEAMRRTEHELLAAAHLAWVLRQAGRWQEAENLLRALFDQAVQQAAFREASLISNKLVNVLRSTGRSRAALVLLEQQDDRGRSDPWAQLGNEAQRLQLLMDLGECADPLAAVGQLRATMGTLPEISDQKAAEPWNVRERILNMGVQAASGLGDWKTALDLNAEVLRSEKKRGAPALTLAGTRLNEANLLLTLKLPDYNKARTVLEECRVTFEAEQDFVKLGRVFSCLARLEDRVHGPDQAIPFARTALRYGYQSPDPDDSAVIHSNLSGYLQRKGEQEQEALAHRLTAVLIFFQISSGRLPSALKKLTRHLATFPDALPLPAEFSTLCAIVENVEGVYFQDLFERLPTEKAVTGDEALQKVLDLAKATNQN